MPCNNFCSVGAMVGKHRRHNICIGTPKVFAVPESSFASNGEGSHSSDWASWFSSLCTRDSMSLAETLLAKEDGPHIGS